MNITITNHAAKRMNQRHIPETMVYATRWFGRKIYAQNSLYFFLGKRENARMLKEFMPEKALVEVL